jgi:hypothetical protein
VNRRWLDEAIDDAGLGTCHAFPRDLISDAALRLPLTTILLPRLSALAVRKWLAARGIDHPVADRDRLLHGCLVAQAAVGAVFIDANDCEDERRFSFAHEVAHFILDHLRPRQHALRTYGDRILPVLNGDRPPTKEESLSSVLDRVPIGVQVHLMSRGPAGAVCEWDIEAAEQNADRLAFELLAPAQTAMAAVRPAFESSDSTTRLDNAAALLVQGFGLPLSAAKAYADVLIGQRRQTAFSTLELLGLKS